MLEYVLRYFGSACCLTVATKTHSLLYLAYHTYILYNVVDHMHIADILMVLFSVLFGT